ncbi:hypothetical protein GLUCOINTEAF2_0204237 [Komagataeibacter intermedius AF2]|uniref:Uncharacterized protein n=1 Tax=Komagataeibacter intermedius AF2 TaxID=1458464 RepID=A0A0C1UVW7_9PROT|nr:hypothetical protein [Komagataeibacter intermedius]KPH86963.1 hypothetical protein GLUCOINTEAF2_0204237 [Komagataeibacter intermedius AF2]
MGLSGLAAGRLLRSWRSALPRRRHSTGFVRLTFLIVRRPGSMVMTWRWLAPWFGKDGRPQAIDCVRDIRVVRILMSFNQFASKCPDRVYFRLLKAMRFTHHRSDHRFVQTRVMRSALRHLRMKRMVIVQRRSQKALYILHGVCDARTEPGIILDVRLTGFLPQPVICGGLPGRLLSVFGLHAIEGFQHILDIAGFLLGLRHDGPLMG